MSSSENDTRSDLSEERDIEKGISNELLTAAAARGAEENERTVTAAPIEGSNKEEAGRDAEKSAATVDTLSKVNTNGATKRREDAERAAELAGVEPRYIVDWEGNDDAENPLNWPVTKKWGNMGIVSAITFITPLASSMFAPGVPDVMREFKSTNVELASFVVSIYILGFAIGPMVIAPLSELYGRLKLYLSCGVLFIIFTILCAISKNMGMLIAFRFLAGCAGAAPLTIGGGSIADIMVSDKRGAAMAIFALGPLLGPVIGPVAGGYLTQAKGWRWAFWVVAIASGFITIISFIFLKETYAPTLLHRKALRIRHETGDPLYRSKYASNSTPTQVFKAAIIRPLKMLLLSPIIFFMSLHMALVYGIIYFLFTTFTFVFEDEYGFSAGSAGLTFIGLGVGNLIGVVGLGIMSDRILRRLTAKNGGQEKPEYRLPPMIFTCWCIPVGLFWYGWSAQKHTHWIVPIIGTSFVGIGMLSVMMPVQNYIIDAFTLYAASGVAAGTILRSLFGAIFPLASQALYDRLGLGWGNSLLGFLALATAPVPWVFWRFGEKIRTRSVLKLD